VSDEEAGLVPAPRKPCEKICYPKRIQAELVFREMGDDTLVIYPCHRHVTDGVRRVYFHLGHPSPRREKGGQRY
jgi:hypothetical protein